MIHPVETLMNEHRVIERGLDSLDSLSAGLSTTDPAARVRLGELVRFFREYADRVHHAKEEDRLFTALAAHGFSSQSGPVFVMLSEHEAGRAHVTETGGSRRRRRSADIGGGGNRPGPRDGLLDPAARPHSEGGQHPLPDGGQGAAAPGRRGAQDGLRRLRRERRVGETPGSCRRLSLAHEKALISPTPTFHSRFPREATFNIVGSYRPGNVDIRVSNNVENGTSAARLHHLAKILRGLWCGRLARTLRPGFGRTMAWVCDCGEPSLYLGVGNENHHRSGSPPDRRHHPRLNCAMTSTCARTINMHCRVRQIRNEPVIGRA